ncbi:RING zinc finger protein [Plasmodium gonderi]|uniref:RING zinc finger protein n=1 Tax=Plasmodium gonderi TaxID=77519 RepID=A0A1Y1JEQ0_PLAGO|nr:RING zinc finger protein [Plasmodium gonderi]GAW81001.1 RING zinc finger protein [Plasmodium gonderi]
MMDSNEKRGAAAEEFARSALEAADGDVNDATNFPVDRGDEVASELSNVYEDATENGDNVESQNNNMNQCNQEREMSQNLMRKEIVPINTSSNMLINRFGKCKKGREDEEKHHSNKCTMNSGINKEGNNNDREWEDIPSEVECAICMKLLIIPVTIPCGHNFCRDCLEKAKEYNNSCPLCRSNMGDKKNINILLADLIKEKYPLTYAKRVEEMEKMKRDKEEKILKERFDAIKNSSVIPLFKVPLTSGPYFPGEVFDLNIYNEKFINLIEFISTERTFAITSSKDKGENGDDKMYGIHVKILQQSKINQVFCIKCVANFRVILYNIIHFPQYENYIASHSPLFDETVPFNLFEYSLLRASHGVGKSSGSSFQNDKYRNNISFVENGRNSTCKEIDKIYEDNCKVTDKGGAGGGVLTNKTIINLGKEKVEKLKALLNKIELEDDINSISLYYDQYRTIINNSCDTTDYNIYNAVNYYSCVIFSRICLLCIRYQLNRFGNAGIRLFNSKFRNVKLTSSEPSNEELEKFSYSLSSAIISRSILKWRWFKTTNTTERLESITQYFLRKKNKSILALDNSRSPLIHRLFMLDSILSSLLFLVFFLIIIFVKYFSSTEWRWRASPLG